MRNITIISAWITFSLFQFFGTTQAIEVTNEAELREAILSIQNATEPIVIEITRTINLSSELPLIGKAGVAVTIIGADGIKINGNNECRGFFIDAGDPETSITISNIQFMNCLASGGDGGEGISGGGGGAGLGGAIFVKSGNIVLENVIFRENQAVGGSGGTAIEGSEKYGGGGGLGRDAVEKETYTDPESGFIMGENGEYGEGGGGSEEIAGKGGFGGGGGAGSGEFRMFRSGDGGFGGGGGGNVNPAFIGNGGIGAGDGGNTEEGGTGGGGLGAGGALFVSEGASVTIKNTTTSETFKNNSSSGGLGGGGTAGNGDALGNAIFLTGNVIFDTAGQTNVVSENIDSQVAATNYSLLADSGSDSVLSSNETLSVTGGGTLLLKGVNTYAGTTQIIDGTLLAQGGEAIGDSSMVWISAEGVLSLRDSETIGSLSGLEGGHVQLYYISEIDPENPAKMGGKTLTVAGDADTDSDDSFAGKIETDGNSSTTERLIKSGTGTLVLAGDNTNKGDEFLTEIKGGTIRLEHSQGLGGGNVTVSVASGSSTQSAIEAGIDGLVLENDIKINSGSEMRIGAAASSAEEIENFTIAGEISGPGSLVLDMVDRDQVLLLSNMKNSYTGTTQLENGTLAIIGEANEDGTWTSSLGTGKIVATTGGDAGLQVNTDGMVIANTIQIDADSLMFTNETAGINYEITGSIQGKGGIEVYMNDADDILTLSGKNTYTGLTTINRGTLILGASEISFAGGLSLLEDGKLDLAGNSLILTDNNDSSLAGSIIDSSGGDGSLYKNGTGTLDLELQTRLGLLSISSGTTKLLNEDSVAQLTMKGDAVLELHETDAMVASLSGTTNTILDVGDNTLTIRGDDTQVFDGTIHGSGTIIMEQTPDSEDLNIWGLSGNSSATWTGQMVVREGTKLVSGSYYSLGKVIDEDGGDNVASVSLEGGMLATYGTTFLGRLDVGNGTGTIETTYGTALNLYDIVGDQGFTKNNLGTLTLYGANENYTGTTTFKQGYIYLLYGSTLGSGNLVSTGTEDLYRLLAFEVPEYNEDGSGGQVVFANNIELESTLNVGLYGNGNGVAVLSGEITGEAGLAKSGGGILVLTGSNNTYSGATEVLSGVLQLGDAETKTGSDLLYSDVIVSSGAVLQGVGTIKSLSVEAGGIVLPGFSPGVLSVLEDMTMDTGSGYGIVLDDENSAGSGLNVAGKATVNGGILYVDTSNTEIELGSVYTFITASELQVANSLFITEELQNVRAVSVVDEENGTYGFEFVEFDYEREGQDASLAKLGAYLNDIADNSYYSDSTSEYLLQLNALLNSDIASGERMMREMMGEIHDTAVDAHLHSLTNLNQLIAAQLRPTNAVEYTNGTVRGQSNYNLGGRAAWFTAYGSTGNVDSRGSASGYDYTNYGGVGAIEFYSCNALHFGGYYAYGKSEFDTGGSFGKSKVDDHLFGTYLKWNGNFGHWIVSAGYGISNYKTNRRAGDENIFADYDGWQIPFYLEKGFTFGNACNMIQPYLGVQYVYLKQDDITEYGSELGAVQIGSRDMNSLRSILGVRATMNKGSVHHPFQISAHGAWIHEYLDLDGLSNIRSAGIAGTSGFDVKGNRIGKDWFSAGLGAEWHLSGNWSLFGTYEYQFNNHMNLHNGNAGIRIIW